MQRLKSFWSFEFSSRNLRIFFLLLSACSVLFETRCTLADTNASHAEDGIDLQQAIREANTPLERVQILLFLREFIPGLFQNAAVHDTNLLDLLSQHATLVSKLEQNADYQKLRQTKHPLLHIKINATEPSTLAQVTLDPDAIAHWKTELMKVAENLREEEIEESLRAEILKILHELSVLNPKNSYRQALLKIIPKERQLSEESPILGRSKNEIFEFFSKHLPDDLLALGFDPKRLGWELQEFKKAEAIRRLQKINDLESRLERLGQLAILVSSQDGKIPQTKGEILDRISAIGEGSIDFFRDSKIYTERRQAFLKWDAMNQKKHQGEIWQFDQNVLVGIRRLEAQKVVSHSTVNGDIELLEVPPEVGILRGCVGGDCSTSHSWQVANAPNERIFLVGDKKGWKGYVAGALVEISGKKTFYVASINGPRISASDTALALLGLEKIKTQLGAEQISLPESKNLVPLINFTPIREVVTQAIAKTPSVAQIYPDASVRDPLLAGSYDGSTYNSQAHIFNASIFSFQPKVEVTIATPIRYRPRPVTQKDLILFALDMNYIESENEYHIQDLPEFAPIRDYYLKLVHVLKNRDRQSFNIFRKNIEYELAKLDLTPEDLKNSSYCLWTGLLNTHEAQDLAAFTKLDSESQTEILSAIVAKISQGNIRTFPSTSLKKLAGPLSQYKPFQNHLRSLANLDAQNLPQLMSLLTHTETDADFLKDEFDKAFSALTPAQDLDEGITVPLRHIASKIAFDDGPALNFFITRVKMDSSQSMLLRRSAIYNETARQCLFDIANSPPHSPTNPEGNGNEERMLAASNLEPAADQNPEFQNKLVQTVFGSPTIEPLIISLRQAALHDKALQERIWKEFETKDFHSQPLLFAALEVQAGSDLNMFKRFLDILFLNAPRLSDLGRVATTLSSLAAKFPQHQRGLLVDHMIQRINSENISHDVANIMSMLRMVMGDEYSRLIDAIALRVNQSQTPEEKNHLIEVALILGRRQRNKDKTWIEDSTIKNKFANLLIGSKPQLKIDSNKSDYADLQNQMLRLASAHSEAWRHFPLSWPPALQGRKLEVLEEGYTIDKEVIENLIKDLENALTQYKADLEEARQSQRPQSVPQFISWPANTIFNIIRKAAPENFTAEIAKSLLDYATEYRRYNGSVSYDLIQLLNKISDPKVSDESCSAAIKKIVSGAIGAE